MRHGLAWVLGLSACLVAASASASSSDLTPCRGAWKGTGTDPWNPDDPYTIELQITGRAEHCASVTYPGMCASRWVNCKVSGEWVFADEEILEPAGDCIPTRVTLRCVDSQTVEVKYEAELGIMQTTLHRVITTPPEPIAVQPQTPAQPRLDDPEQDQRGCRCSFAWIIVLPLPLLGRRFR